MADLTTADLARLRVPLASLPGLDPVGLVVATWTGYHRNDPEPSGRELFALWSPNDGAPLVVERGVGLRRRYRVEADLSDRSTRNRVAEWLAGRVGLEVGSTAPVWVGYIDGWRLLGTEHTQGNLRLFTWDTGGTRTATVPALADLHPVDDRRLPDGSRFVDAWALALVAVHVGGAR